MIAEAVDEGLSRLSEFDKRVIDCILGGNERMPLYIDITRKRKNWIYQDPTIVITPLIVARALCVDVCDVIEAFDRLKVVFADSLIK